MAEIAVGLVRVDRTPPGLLVTADDPEMPLQCGHHQGAEATHGLRRTHDPRSQGMTAVEHQYARFARQRPLAQGIEICRRRRDVEQAGGDGQHLGAAAGADIQAVVAHALAAGGQRLDLPQEAGQTTTGRTGNREHRLVPRAPGRHTGRQRLQFALAAGKQGTARG